MTEPFYLAIEQFSEAYELVHNARVFTHSGNKALMDSEMYNTLVEEYGLYFAGKVGKLHYNFKPEASMPAGSIAVPEHNHDDPDTLLIQL
jgi:hypothetical protein